MGMQDLFPKSVRQIGTWILFMAHQHRHRAAEMLFVESEGFFAVCNTPDEIGTAGSAWRAR